MADMDPLLERDLAVAPKWFRALPWVIALLLLLNASRTGVIQAVSPDKRFIARAVYPSFLAQLTGPRDSDAWNKKMRVRVEIIDVQTGLSIKAYEGIFHQIFGDDEVPQDILWSADSKRFAYLYQEEGPIQGKVFHATRQPLAVRESKSWADVKWMEDAWQKQSRP
jgi:hypothetical protein